MTENNLCDNKKNIDYDKKNENENENLLKTTETDMNVNLIVNSTKVLSESICNKNIPTRSNLKHNVPLRNLEKNSERDSEKDSDSDKYMDKHFKKYSDKQSEKDDDELNEYIKSDHEHTKPEKKIFSEYKKNNNEKLINSENYKNSQSDNKETNNKPFPTIGSMETKFGSLINDDKKYSQEELILMKLDMLRKLGELANSGVKLSQVYNMYSDYNVMKYEYELHRSIRAKKNAIGWMSNVLLTGIYGIEMLSEKYNPFDLKIRGWSEQMNADITSYYDVFGELYEKYNKPGKSMSPELKLIGLLGFSAFKFHMANKLSSALNLQSFFDKKDENQEIIEELREKAVKDKLKQQEIKQKELINTKAINEHNLANKKMEDINYIRQQELKYLENKQKKIEEDIYNKQQVYNNYKNQLNNNKTINSEPTIIHTDLDFIKKHQEQKKNNINSNIINPINLLENYKLGNRGPSFPEEGSIKENLNLESKVPLDTVLSKEPSKFSKGTNNEVFISSKFLNSTSNKFNESKVLSLSHDSSSIDSINKDELSQVSVKKKSNKH